jgi:GxxExxY protein
MALGGALLAPPRRMLVDASGLSHSVIAAAIEVHRVLGPGLLESAYSRCLGRELGTRGLPFRREIIVPVVYKGERVDHGFRADMVVAERLLVEVKCVSALLPIHRAQAITYLKLLDLKHGLIINFYSRRLVDGIRSVIG